MDFISDNKKEITIYDIARELNISPATVSRGLNDHPAVKSNTKKKIVQLAKDLGYQSNTFASNLRKKRTNTIGLILPTINSNFHSSVIAGVEKVANDAGYTLLISQSLEAAGKEAANAKTMFNSRVDGLLVSLAYETNNIEHFQPFINKGIPLIFYDRVFEHKNCTSIVIDNFKAGYEVTQHLISQGAKKLVHITGNLNRNVYADRLKGFKLALMENEIPFSKDNVLAININKEEDLQEAITTILGMPERPDGIFVANDTSAVILIKALKKEKIKVPGDIMVVGFNNDPISKVIEPNLTTVNYPGYEMGEVAARNLINHLNGVMDIISTNTIILRSDLIIRESSLRNL
ncbi:LacI family DNA-binding transcriptional regulator [Adhaeribacter aquaticus]|uniref:LacI family DNA-binding transcriptional regulator n=1 Tax=Adhaeribacter aquaticus TaxID=299567 RepID=UPI0003F77D92|nr:LacI family DNA-binding transcriptional regulator [Adhaeribacter aquaticus]